MRIAFAERVDRGAVDALALEHDWRLIMVGAGSHATFAHPNGTTFLAYSEEQQHAFVYGHDASVMFDVLRTAFACTEEEGEPPNLARPFPERPRLLSSVLARLHVVDGEPKVILHEWHTGTIAEIAPASWQALMLADGTRDLDALCLALAREEIYAGRNDLMVLLAELQQAGVLAEGLPAPPPPVPITIESTPPERPLSVLPFTLVCDGRGSCCRFYGSVAFTPIEAMRARILAEDMELALHPDELFTPLSGGQMKDLRAVAQIDGRCAFLEPDGRCGLHRRAGPSAKPLPCQFYPATLVDDGEEVRVSLGPECACIFASIGRDDGVPLVAPDARVLGDLPSGVGVMRVPDPVPLSETKTASRAELRAWSALLCAHLERTEEDAIAIAWTLADAVSHGLDGIEPAREPSAELAAWLHALAERAASAAGTHESWRSTSDLSRRVARWIADALAEQREIAPALDPIGERFYLRALAHGHRLALEGRTLEHGLRDRATRIAAARAMARFEPSRAPSGAKRSEVSRRTGGSPPEASEPHPLALLEAAMRNLGLTGYRDELLGR